MTGAQGKRTWSTALTMAMLLPGCATRPVGPDYVPPQPDVPQHWAEAPMQVDATDTARRLQAWWSEFHDPMLDRLVGLAIASNYDLRIAEQHIIAARAERDVAIAATRPRVSIGASAQEMRSSTTLDWPPGIGESRTLEAGFDASWEIDVFGGLRRSVEAANADVGAVAEARRSILISLLAEIASDYAMLRSAQQRVAIAQRNIEILTRSLALVERSRRAGTGTDFDVSQARAELEANQALIPTLRAEIARMAHAIGILAGGFPGDLEAELLRQGSPLPAVPTLPVSMPSEVVRQRPDIRAAERRLASATARVGVAVADLFPHFRIPLTFGPQTSALGQLLSAASFAWTIGLTGTQRLYDGGRTNARIRTAKAITEADRLNYERTIRAAFRDVEDALVNINSERERRTSLVASAKDSERALARATQLYRGGLSGYLNVLVAQRAVYQVHDSLAQSDLAQIQNTIALFKALGGGAPDCGNDCDNNSGPQR